VYMCSPNNPTGNLIDQDAIRQLLAMTAGTPGFPWLPASGRHYPRQARGVRTTRVSSSRTP
ncbi:hypothetical protein, partial [uncultured Stenotrophomonas sp.]|uniref:hypothetical protein n=1 Tax=uncultured Stenotrophomonas sp. TaxID=165438 RepID=UPI00258DD995